ncbi:MAG TPA: sigma-70 family RNA polymerase sigma factor [Actinomycetes bacterium]|jgi:RNA polymerase sigma-B factor|nr:sigma-70 family RNA polymerase sigma factor [Actinomycetes bacterium]
MPAAAFSTLDCRPQDVRRSDQDAVDRVEDWFRAYHATGDPTIREQIILAHLGLADRLAARFHKTHGPAYEDLVQSARVGLVGAVNRYDPNRANPFVVYAIVCITGELKRFLRDTSWRLHVARSGKERAMRVLRARDRLTAILGRRPTTSEIAAAEHLDEDGVAEALQTVRSQAAVSLDQPAGQDGTTSIAALLPAPDAAVEVEDLLVLPGLLASLPDMERRAVALRFFEDLKQWEIGAVLGYSQMHVSRLLRRALLRMGEQLWS